MTAGTRRGGVFIAALLAAAASGWAQLPEMRITIGQRDSAELYSRDMFDNTFVPAAVEFHGTSWNDVGLRFKGRSHRYYPKKSFRLKFPDDHPFNGAQAVNLHSLYSDKSFIREKLAWILFAWMGTLAPDGQFLLLNLNGRPKGLYFLVDRIDKHFLERHHRAPTALYSVDDEYALGDLTVQHDDLLKLYYPKQVGEKKDIGDLKAMLRELAAAPDSLFEREAGRIFDMRSVYDWLAANIVMMMGDSYNKNYYLYHDLSKTAAAWVIIPWDYDQSFGLSGDPALEYPASLLNDGFGYTFPPLAGPGNVLKDRLWNTPAMRERLRRRVAELLETVFTEERMGRAIDSLATLVRPEVARDPAKWGTGQEFEDHIEGLREFVAARRQFLLATFVNSPTGGYTTVTLRAGTLNAPMRFVTVDGRLIGTLALSSAKGLDSIRLTVHPGALPPAAGLDNGRFVRRWLEIAAVPEGAAFSARLAWMYHDLSSRDREVPGTVADERSLRCVRFDGTSWDELPSRVNPVSNTVFVDSLSVNHRALLGIRRR
jgi:spore coat protein H